METQAQEMIEYVVGFFFNESQDRVALILKNKPEWQAGKWNGIGGKVETKRNEHFADAMVREFSEEAGVTWRAWQFKLCIYQEGVYRAMMFSASNDEVYNVRTMEREQVALHDVGLLPRNTIPNLRWIIPLMLDKTVRFPLWIPDTRF